MSQTVGSSAETTAIDATAPVQNQSSGKIGKRGRKGREALGRKAFHPLGGQGRLAEAGRGVDQSEPPLPVRVEHPGQPRAVDPLADRLGRAELA